MSKTIDRGLTISEEITKESKELSKNIFNMSEKLVSIPTKDIINLMLGTAIEFNTGDVHIEPSDDGVKIRFRIDGILHDVATLPKNNYLPLLSEIKILSGFPTNIKRATWDGRFSVKLPKEKIDCRISIISGGYGETVVIRLLNNQASALNMEKLGLEPYALIPIKKSISATKGMIITTGPTGSGKTTTLYSLLNAINNSNIKIITIEDPIEYHMDGVMQTQIDTDKGYTFAEALRSLLRQNPNVIMVGEIRDKETASVAIESSMTGHLVFSTIHANSAAGAIPRFIGLGIDKEMLINAINCTISQRLVRKICPRCRQETKIDSETLNEIKIILNSIHSKANIKIPERLKFYKGAGCEYCGGIGYRGRIGVYEVIEMLPEIQKIIQNPSVTNYDIEQAAVAQGTVLMLQDGILKALKGETTIEEVFRVAK
ncbi:hypothetical protein A2331_01905 [Candidatus Falkowbacteria bacterium RIFOXYB2_FULL_34_18]|uniref:Bacterial type II secretion system protein E domain-containing protein n=1 Tax=Candidatus Falkowbacteria bacterium RIFOXYD2_FULL_34_120 TaxID=1798007 RepID=A0A1F5TQI5_9BACT|nr:MAG: hypothetical protein A2331_01905 [Candidatus Falkowbacteria bacterium RIFOXYB2_FULL_34_18]OGF29467.1 MAG: hypothetical protein A2500_00970 [Candidatus Falkowbacteria bacterium RIFOXYC12_FULL_34_55]OGF36780.1 MAG: hypothetical protein A2466_03280 [Candidatus Falkowbacteria bacterium RIFOXYC2_FULL_34_220]OGF38993.1 MAG: hypothetical protein A2515_05395 [Candidatus Falkowbacteria bacterium RIFOXYD12_FULL_34_57]OGF41186.1 MAG: hypothetical protein A2531_01395 [Candidatus Falkowbacteria bact